VNTLIKGKKGEDIAGAYLEKQGYNIRHRNFYHQKAEIDIIASKNEILAIVEVKLRISDFYGAP